MGRSSELARYKRSKVIGFLFHGLFSIVCVPGSLSRLLGRSVRLLKRLLLTKRSSIKDGSAQIAEEETAALNGSRDDTVMIVARGEKKAKEDPASVNVLDYFGFRRHPKSQLLRELCYSDESYTGSYIGGDLHTILYGVARPQLPPALLRYERDITTSDFDGNRLCIDWAFAELKTNSIVPANPVKGILVIFPGLNSSSKGVYVQRLARYSLKHGYHVAVVNTRGMGSTPLDTPLLPSAYLTADMKSLFKNYFTTEALTKRFGALFVSGTGAPTKHEGDENTEAPPATALPILACGYSLGGTILTSYLSQVGKDTPIHAAAALTPVWDLHASAKQMTTTLMSHLFYQPPFAKGFISLLKRQANTLLKSEDPSIREYIQGILKNRNLPRSIADVEANLIIKMYGFSNIHSYYTAASPCLRMGGVGVPLLCVTSEGDPVCGPAPPLSWWRALCDRNPNLLFVSVPDGGHIGFLNSPVAEFLDKPNWLEARVLKAFDCAVRNVNTKE